MGAVPGIKFGLAFSESSGDCLIRVEGNDADLTAAATENARLLAAGHTFKSSTDTEVLAHLIGEHYQKRRDRPSDLNPLTQAVCDALREVIGTYGIAVVSSDHPGVIIGARRGSPLIVGVGEGENLLASDASALRCTSASSAAIWASITAWIGL